MMLRNATLADVNALAEVEKACFPPAEAASLAAIRERVAAYGDCFWLLFQEAKLLGFIDGMVTDEKDLRDEMYQDASLHNPQGKWQMIFGLNTLPEYRLRGYAGQMIKAMIESAEKSGRTGVVLTCKEPLLHYYHKFGFINEGISESTHGDVLWYQMRLLLK